MIDHLLAKLRLRDTVSEEEEALLRASVALVRTGEAGEVIVPEKTEQTASTLLLAGYVCRAKTLEDGRRQILELHVPGDFLDLHSFMLGALEHDVVALSGFRIAQVPHSRLRALTEQSPHLGRLLWFSTLIDASIYREWMVSIGRRPAIGRLAHLFREIEARLEIVGLAENGRYRLPVTQADLADATGLTAVHVNRMLRELRDDGVVEFRNGQVAIRDRRRLEQIGEFDPAYLHLDKRPR